MIRTENDENGRPWRMIWGADEPQYELVRSFKLDRPSMSRMRGHLNFSSPRTGRPVAMALAAPGEERGVIEVVATELSPGVYAVGVAE